MPAEQALAAELCLLCRLTWLARLLPLRCSVDIIPHRMSCSCLLPLLVWLVHSPTSCAPGGGAFFPFCCQSVLRWAGLSTFWLVRVSVDVAIPGSSLPSPSPFFPRTSTGSQLCVLRGTWGWALFGLAPGCGQNFHLGVESASSSPGSVPLLPPTGASKERG